MTLNAIFRAVLVACAFFVQSALARELAAPAQELEAAAQAGGEGVQKILEHALDLVGIRYHRGGTSATSGFDCSGFVGYVFREGLGMTLPRTSREISRTGEHVAKSELQPGDLVFFHTMRRGFSHVGIYLGDHLFVHAGRSGESVRVEDIRKSYWARRFDGARRMQGD